MSAVTAVSAIAIRGSYLDEGAKQALLGYGGGASFGLPFSRIVTFKASALEDGPVELVPAREGRMVLPISAIAISTTLLESDIVANIGWQAPPDAEDEHDEPWLMSAAPLWFAGEEKGSIVMLPGADAHPTPRLWPECIEGRSLVVKLPGAPLGRTDDEKKSRKRAEAREGEPEAPDPEVTLIVFFTVL